MAQQSETDANGRRSDAGPPPSDSRELRGDTPPETSTVEDVVRSAEPAQSLLHQLRRARWIRRAFLALLVLLVLVGLLGTFDVRNRSVSQSAQGYEVTVHYPRTGRPGLPANWYIEVAHEGGLPQQVTLLVSGSYLDAFESTTVSPQASSESAQGDLVEWTFDAPDNGPLVVRINTRFSTGWQAPIHGRVELVEQNQPIINIGFTTWKLP
jgi:hypothetical protein